MARRARSFMTRATVSRVVLTRLATSPCRGLGLDHRLVVTIHVFAGLAQEFRVHPVVGAERTEVHDPLVRGAHHAGQLDQHLGGHRRVLFQDIKKILAGQGGDQTVGQGDHPRRARPSIDRRQLPEIISRGQLVEGNLASGKGVVDHAHPAFNDHIDAPGMAVAVDHLLVRDEPFPGTGLLDGAPLRLGPAPTAGRCPQD